ncbi:uncharacterized protein EI90DRAFT_3090513 [Cantharellus anzutake]|uniref:uncharacterized protein n=1 Tax=Cantharellus anzutake TaxID=1750568 RepID=UPI001904BC9F|nr:uncharacterized protein EI90DRAFT_3090513 [Cantharellus anzutake]KAF8314365.1 hypothetical protein EI90DRAFT_3090513 [Cantharellus anzutake]
MASECSYPDPGNPDEFCLQRNFPLRAGILLVSEIGLVSFTLATSLLIYFLVPGHRVHPEGLEYEVQPMSVLFLFALSLNAIQGTSNVMSVKWALEGEVTEGSYCTAQAVMRQIGNDGVAWFTIAIVVLTYLQVFHPGFIGVRGQKIFMAASIGFISLFIFIMVLIPAATLYPYYGDTGLWCWIVKRKENSRFWIASENAWTWLAVSVTLVAYGIIALWDGILLVRITVPHSQPSYTFPVLVYFVVVAPQSVLRLLQFQASQTRHGWTILTSAIFSSGGALNVIFWLWTGRRFGFSLRVQELERNQPRPEDVELDQLVT